MKVAWFYDLRTNKHFTLKQNRLTRADLDEFVSCFRPGDRHNRMTTWSEANPDGRWRPYTCEEFSSRDKASLDIFWLREDSLEDSANLPEPHVLAEEIAEDLRAALAQIEDVLGVNRRFTRWTLAGPTLRHVLDLGHSYAQNGHRQRLPCSLGLACNRQCTWNRCHLLVDPPLL